MDTYVQQYQPHNYDNWLKGSDMGWHPERPLAIIHMIKSYVELSIISKFKITDKHHKCTTKEEIQSKRVHQFN